MTADTSAGLPVRSAGTGPASLRHGLAVAAGTATLLAAAVPARADETVLEPSTPWVLDATPSGCALRRGFGPADAPHVIEIQRFAPGDGFQLIVSGNGLRGITASTVLRVKYGSLPGHDDPVGFTHGETGSKDGKAIPTIFASSRLDGKSVGDKQAAVTPQMEAQANDITLQSRGRSITLKTGPLDKPFAAIRRCTDALVESWGLDPAVQNSLTRPPMPLGIKAWPQRIDYPSGPASRGQQARVNLRLLVDAEGKITDCKVLRSYNEPAFDKAACKSLMSFARFEPALDRGGTPVASFFQTAITWSM